MRRFLILIVTAILITSCGSGPASPAETTTPVILTSTTVLADITRNIVGDRFAVQSLLPVGSDPHSYQATPQDIARVSESKLIIVNGAGYENFLQTLLDNTSGDATLIEASAGISPREDPERGPDPHMWLNPNLVLTYVENIRAALTQFDPAGEETYRANADAYSAKLNELDASIFEQVGQIPIQKRLLITNHESFGYFAERYGFIVVGTVVESFSTDASPSAQQLAALIDQIQASGASAIFLDASDNTTLAQQIAEETGVKVVTDLHLESLTDGAPAATYIDMMKHNVSSIVEALK